MARRSARRCSEWRCRLQPYREEPVLARGWPAGGKCPPRAVRRRSRDRLGPGGDDVSPLNIAAWRSFPLRSRLAAATGIPVFVDNDAKALALGEGWIGAARGHGEYVAMVVSTGVGGGIVLDGRLLNGRLGN